jgi:ERI1 exoribonuclease 2
LYLYSPYFSIGDEKKISTELSYIIVIDFESTCWENMSFYKSTVEIIEFPAVLMNLANGQIENQFQQFVMPVEQPKLSDFCTKLTGNKIYKTPLL